MKKNVLLLISFCLAMLFCNMVSAQNPSATGPWSGTHNLIKNWNFDTDMTSWGGWVDGGLAGQIAPKSVDGVAVMKPSLSPDAWHYQHNQSPLTAEPNVAYTLKFKSWATADGTPCNVDFESGSTITAANGGDQYNRYGTTTDPESADGKSEWHYTVGTTPQWFTFHVVFDKMIPTTVQKLQWMLSLSNETIYLDSIYLVKDEDFVPVSEITLNTEGTITTKGGTLQMTATVAPENAIDQRLTWSVSPADIATISPDGLLTAITNGTVTVKAVAADGSLVEATTEVVITEQLDGTEIWGGSNNLITNWNFDTDVTGWSGWVDGGLAGQIAPKSVDGVCVMKPSKSADSWHYQHGQSPLNAEANVAYTLKFKSWATADATPCVVDFEDTQANAYNRYGTTTDPESADGKSEWHYNVGTTPQWFTFHVVFDKMVPSTVQKLQWLLSLSNETIYLDSVLLIKDEFLVPVSGITLNAGGTIKTKGGSLQMTATIAPSNATDKKVTWSVSPEGLATISPEGLLTALLVNGTVTVKAVAADGSMTEATTDVVITGQLDGTELWGSTNNLIKNWNFDTDVTGWSGWVDGGLAGQVAPKSVDGVCVMKPSKSADSWHYQHGQSPLNAEANVAYTLKFKSWATADATPCVVDFEDTQANAYNRYGTTTDPESADGKSEWHYNVGTTPQWFTFHVVFDKMVETTVQKLQWMLSLSNETIYLDSVLLVKDEFLVPVTEITLNTEGTIETNRGTLQMTATVAPENATDKKVTWTVSPEGLATISADGLLKALDNGTVTVKAVAADGSLVEATTDVVISGQVAEKDLWSSEFNLIKNWNFDTDMTSWGGWVDAGLAGQVAPISVDGVAVMKPSFSVDSWHYQHGQSPLNAEANVAYTLKFKSWATADATPCVVDFEDTQANGYNRYGATTDPESADLRSEWHYNVGTTPQWFTFHVVFDKMVPSTVQKLQWLLSLSNETISLDSILLVKDEYLTLLPAPVANAGADVTANEGAVVTLDASKSAAPNAEALTYRWIAPAGITLSSTTEAKPTFTAPAVTVDKTYTLTLVVSYGTAKPVADQVVVTVKQVDVAPTVKAAIADISVFKGAALQVIDLATVFADADGDVLTYTVVNSNDDVVSAFIADGKLNVSFSTINTGTSVMEVTATANGKSVKSTFNIEVKLINGIQDMADVSMQVYPNPTSGSVELTLSEVSKAGTMITVYNYAGQVVYQKVTAKTVTTIDLSGKPAGMYFVKVGKNTSKLLVK